MRILAPVDFSEPAKNAAVFAYHVATQLSAELLLIHVLPDLGPTMGRQDTSEVMNQLQETADADFRTLLSQLPKGNVSVSTTISHGSVIHETLRAVIETNGINLVIMGSKGAGGAKRALIGSNAVDVINNCNTPVIVVPDKAVITKIESLVYASDFTNLRDEVKTLIPFAESLGAYINIINLSPRFYVEYVDTDRLINDMQRENKFERIKVTMLQGENITQILEDYVLASRGELLTMFTHHASFLEQLFRRSIAREIAWHNKIPLLVYPHSRKQ